MTPMTRRPRRADRAARRRAACWPSARQDDPAAWERLVRLYAPLVASWCRRWGVAEQDMGDVLQDVFAAVAEPSRPLSQGAAGRHVSRLAVDDHRGTRCATTFAAEPASRGRRRHRSRAAAGADARSAGELNDDCDLPTNATRGLQRRAAHAPWSRFAASSTTRPGRRSGRRRRGPHGRRRGRRAGHETRRRPRRQVARAVAAAARAGRPAADFVGPLASAGYSDFDPSPGLFAP